MTASATLQRSGPDLAVRGQAGEAKLKQSVASCREKKRNLAVPFFTHKIGVYARITAFVLVFCTQIQ
jgi:hypothetical protein